MGSIWQEHRTWVTWSVNSRHVRSGFSLFVLSAEAMLKASIYNPLGLQYGVILFPSFFCSFISWNTSINRCFYMVLFT